MAALQYRVVSALGDMYRPEFRRGETGRWWFMRRDGKPLEFPSAHAAKRAAVDMVALDEASRNPSHVIEVETPEALGSFAEWKEGKARELEQERRSVFGSAKPATLYLPGGRQVKVEARKVRRVPA